MTHTFRNSGILSEVLLSADVRGITDVVVGQVLLLVFLVCVVVQPVYVKHVDSSTLGFSFSSHRLSFISLIFISRFLDL